ncbi:peroxiredoxin Q/BCP [Litorimonas taeanensis]|uniref:thioredoxin-dependent peroxiredoxin n=1 Tax=Litorimonas taeanensis TaxID=568099 RepID=A0A420WJU1_9PROT|nr:thioredoxin-dependent thiol peroxidase [Litorimonas taeanensis]RKQ71268.1 peroxiredoxin Q/BCP [Litorimonas taeanensis]
MSDLNIGDKAPDFSVEGDGGNTVSLSEFKGKNVVLYFYPKDDTPGCTKEAIGFSEMKLEFDNEGAIIIGVSKDTAAKHDKFIAKHDLKVRLAADTEGDIVEKYGVWVEKNMYGRKYMGIERATFLIDGDQNIVKIWRKVRVKDHVATVLEAVKSL